MKTIKSLLFALFLFTGTVSWQKSQAQCPSAIFNSTSKVALKDLTCLPPYTYTADLVWDDGSGNPPLVLAQNVSCTVGNNLASDIGGGSAAAGAGYVLNFPANTFPSADCLATGSTLITLRNPSTTAIIVDVAFQDGVLQPDCAVDCIALPITLQSFNSQFTGSQVNLQWVTTQESNSSHFWVLESCNGLDYVRIAKIAAAGSSSSPITYNFTDYTFCKPRSYYRLEMVDLDCKRTFSSVLNVYTNSCGSCPSTPPVASSAYDPCVGVYDLKINGPDRICDNPNFALYRLKNKPFGTTVTWSVSPSGYATVVGTQGYAKVTRINNYAGNITLTASFSNNTSVSKNIALGAPALTVGTTQYYSGYTLVHTATVSPLLQGTTAADYQWYQGSTFIGTGSSMTFYVSPQSTVYYEVRVNTSCGQSIYYGSAYNPSTGGGGGGGTPCDQFLFKVSPNPANGFINLRPLPCDNPPFEYKTAKKSIAAVYTVRIYDRANNVRRTFSNVKIAAGASLRVAIGGLPAGNYLVEMTDGVRKGSNWIIIE